MWAARSASKVVVHARCHAPKQARVSIGNDDVRCAPVTGGVTGRSALRRALVVQQSARLSGCPGGAGRRRSAGR